MPEVRSVSENHGDYLFTVEKNEGKVVSYRRPIEGPSDAPDEPVAYEDLPSRSLKDGYQALNSALLED